MRFSTGPRRAWAAGRVCGNLEATLGGCGSRDACTGIGVYELAGRKLCALVGRPNFSGLEDDFDGDGDGDDDRVYDIPSIQVKSLHAFNSRSG